MDTKQRQGTLARMIVGFLAVAIIGMAGIIAVVKPSLSDVLATFVILILILGFGSCAIAPLIKT